MANTLYDKKEFSLSELLEKSTRNASILIPNLQRPYVWTPDQISCLVDSLFRGWPFGTLLTWEVKSLDEQQVGIPSRPFFTWVNKTQAGEGKEAVQRSPSFETTDLMILDGQQRLQSLILAFGESDGVCMYDAEWMKVKDPSSTVRTNPRYYTTASLFLDLDKFLEEMNKCNHRFRSVALHESKSLCWAVVKPELGSVEHRKGEWPLPLANSERGGLIALKSMWAKTDPARDDDDELEELAREFVKGAFATAEICGQFCDSHGGAPGVVKDVTKFLRRLCELKNKDHKITCLNITGRIEKANGTPEEKQKDKQEYDDAIVGIFTRLNTAGRALTREEITFAWLKSTWNDVGIEGGTYQKAEKFVSELRGIFEPWFVNTERDKVDDAIMGALSILWCVHDVERQGKLLENRELLQAGIIRKMSKFLRENADAIVESAKETRALYDDCNLTSVSDSFNGVEIAWAFFFTGEKARRRIAQSFAGHEKDNSKKSLKTIVRFFLPRWSVLPSWGNYWAAHTMLSLGQISSTIATHVSRVDTAADMNVLSSELKALSRDVIGIVQRGAEKELPLREWERKVSRYRSRLEIWQGLDQNRARFRTLTFRDANGHCDGKLQVDHIVAHDAWKERIEHAFSDGSLSLDQAASVLLGMPDDDIERKKSEKPQEYEERVKNESVGFINNIGNCMLLNAGYNASKRKKQLGDFMDSMYEFMPTTPESLRVDRDAWMNSMKLPEALVYPIRHTIEEIAVAVRQREREIYEELERFIANPEPTLY